MPDAENNAERFNKFLTRKGVKGPCPMCDTNNWSGYDPEPYSRFFVSAKDKLEQLLVQSFFPTYYMYCRNCGFVAHFMKAVVDDESDSGSGQP
jgi:hypothetical protein